jgi:hypothetical protein
MTISVAFATDQVRFEDSPGRIDAGVAVKLSIRGDSPLAGPVDPPEVVSFGAAGAGGSAVAIGAFFEHPPATKDIKTPKTAAHSVFLFIRMYMLSPQ